MTPGMDKFENSRLKPSIIYGSTADTKFTFVGFVRYTKTALHNEINPVYPNDVYKILNVNYTGVYYFKYIVCNWASCTFITATNVCLQN
jgi:hypothetical protein